MVVTGERQSNDASSVPELVTHDDSFDGDSSSGEEDPEFVTHGDRSDDRRRSLHDMNILLGFEVGESYQSIGGVPAPLRSVDDSPC